MASSDILTGEESEALRDSAAADDAAPKADADGVRRLDADYWDRVFKDRAPALESIAERMVSRFKLTGRSYFRQSIKVTTDPARIVRWGGYIRKLEIPASLHEIEIRPLGLRGVVCLNAEFVFVLVDLFFGGDGLAERPSDTAEFTPMEARLAQRFVNALIADMQESWQPLVDLQFAVSRSESNPLFLSVAADSDSLSITTFTFHFGEKQFNLDIALPSVLIEPMQFVKQDKSQNANAKSKGWHSRIKEDVKEAKVTLRAVLAQTEVSLRDLTRARPGDVIPIEAPQTVTLMAGNQPVIEGSFGVIRERNAVQVTRQIDRQKLGEKYGRFEHN